MGGKRNISRCSVLSRSHSIVIGPVCVCGGWAGSVCYHDNSKLRALIFTKLELGLQVNLVTISSWLNFGDPAPPGRGSAAGEYFGSALQPARNLWVYGGNKTVWVYGGGCSEAKFLAPPYYSQRAVFASLWALFSHVDIKYYNLTLI